MTKKNSLQNSNIPFIIKGAAIGLITGFVVSLFRLSIQVLLSQMTNLFNLTHQHPLSWLILVAVILMIWIITSQLIKSDSNIKGSGIPEVEGQLMGEVELNWFSVLWKKFTAGVLSIGSGLFLGREGPSIQLGGAIGQGTAELLHAKSVERRVLIASGAAAGLSAAFNAPMAGTLFILEEVYHNFSPLVWLSALASSLTANFVSANIFGLTPVLNLHHNQNFPLKYYGLLIVVGIVLGILGRLYQKLTLLMPHLYELFLRRIPHYYFGIVPLLLLIPIGYWAPNLIGGGNSLILNLPHQHITIILIVGIFLLRLFFSVVSYGSGLPGGIFLPILTLGALIGGGLGMAFNQLGLLPKEYIVSLVIFSMAGYFAGIGKAPFSAIILITEMVGNLSHLMPLAVVALISYITVDSLGGAPIYESLLQKKLSLQKIQSITGQLDQLEFPIYENSALAQQQVRDIHWPKNTLLARIRRGSNNIIPNGDTVIHPGDTLIILVDSNQRSAVRESLNQTVIN
ncbi:ClC family H(+)/Cl(-) exchange transporter [Lactobacillus sp. YT155]|uniref:ClC family H(+)/Cl(-) exchange transporter n=1 Tax=Lactobacillus sp. YT155 TaxID=3060955 RepID=UPI00265FCBC6|nr:ClC family H(+)/Cl(-) exchange transporter [Lactobacillus sp. YT155]MDO1605699.1 ClC family H(+)/Cl(-) exchange transporter [Lactobacillus sp. YT155]